MSGARREAVSNVLTDDPERRFVKRAVGSRQVQRTKLDEDVVGGMDHPVGGLQPRDRKSLVNMEYLVDTILTEIFEKKTRTLSLGESKARNIPIDEKLLVLFK